MTRTRTPAALPASTAGPARRPRARSGRAARPLQRLAATLTATALALPAAPFVRAQAPTQAQQAPTQAQTQTQTQTPPRPRNARPAARPAPRGAAPVTVNFVNADIEAVTRAFSAMINRPILVDPRVKGVITVYSEQPQSVPQAYQSYLTALRGLGFAVVETAGLLKLVPEAEAKLQTSIVSVGDERVPRADQIVTQIFTLRHENPNNLVAVLRPLISANNTINASPGTNALVITDYAENLRRIAKIIAALDQPVTSDVDVIPLEHVVASDIATVVQRLAESSAGAPAMVPGVLPGGGGGALTVLADARTNALIVRSSNPARIAQVRLLVAKLDRPAVAGGVPGAPGMWVVHLKNADAAKLATVLRAAFAAVAPLGAGAAGGGAPMGMPMPTAAQAATPTQTATAAGTSPATTPVSASAQPQTGGYIQADPSTNSLIITAPEPLYRQLRAMIDQLDERRAQVYIESMIVEVSGGDAADFGVQWMGNLGQVGSRHLYGVQNTPGSVGAGISVPIEGTGGASVTLGDGFNLALGRVVNGALNLTALLRVLQTRAQTNIVSTPTLITLDNEEAKIVVGENVPFITGQFTNTGTATTNPFQTIERKDVGITLRIKPQIGEGGAIRLQIYQEQSAVKATTAAGTSNAGPSTTKRAIEGTVTVDDGQILVLGGLIEDRFDTTVSKVPLLGDIPIVGALFRSENRERKRSNLMVFLRPIVLRDADAQARLSTDRYDQIRARQVGGQPVATPLMPIGSAPVLPQQPPGQPLPAAPLEPPPEVLPKPLVVGPAVQPEAP